ncbi:MAG: tRNA (adenosine(37)-N6)-threonylcarbamoyltransferase complex dimerization subunit type 1 TsaB [Microbacteriaceae bacterium]
MLLAIDTSAGTSVAVVDRDGGVLAERATEDTRRHAEVIGSMISECLAASEVGIPALSGVAVGMGPGPFTGLRVGIAAARAFALGVGKPVVTVVSHDAIAYGWYLRGNVGPLLVVTDARRREVYWSRYTGADEFLLPIRADDVPGSGMPGLNKPAELAENRAAVDGAVRLEASLVSAGQLGMLAEQLYAHRRPFAGDQPLYLRSPDVTLPSGRKRVTG